MPGAIPGTTGTAGSKIDMGDKVPAVWWGETEVNA